MEEKKDYKWLIIIIGLAILGPIIIVLLVYNPHCLPIFPGDSNVWMGFWASYSGTLATIIVAELTFINSRGIENLQRNYYELNSGVNLRLEKVSIVPIIEPGNLNRYKIVMFFHNRAKSLISNISVGDYDCQESGMNKDESSLEKSRLRIEIGRNKDNVDIINPVFGLRNDQAILQFEINLAESETKKPFVDSYFFFSQFPMNKQDIKLDVKLKIEIYPQISNKEQDMGKQDKKKESEKELYKVRYLHMELFPEPEIDEENNHFEISGNECCMEPYKMKIKMYKVDVKPIAPCKDG